MPRGVRGSGPKARATGRIQAKGRQLSAESGETGSGVTAEFAKASGEFKPSAAHEKALALVIADPVLAGNVTLLAKGLGLSRNTVFEWRRNPAWRAWWNTALLELAREQVGPCVQELQRLIYDPEVSAGAKAKLLDTVIKALPKGDGGSVGTAVAAILERWNPHYAQARIVDTRSGIAAEIRGARELAQMGSAAPTPVPPDASTLPIRTQEEISRVGQEAAARMVRTVEVHAPDPTITEHRYTSAPKRPPTLARAAGDGGQKSRSLDRIGNGGGTSSLPETQGRSTTPETPDPPAPPPPFSMPPRARDALGRFPSSAVPPSEVVPRLYPHHFRGGKCQRCGFSEGTLSKWCKGPTPAGDNARGPEAAKRNAAPERDAGLARILRKMRERDQGSGDA